MPKLDTNIHLNKKPYIFFFLAISTLLFFVLIYAMNRDIQYIRVQRELTEKFVVQTGSNVLEESFSSSVSDLFLMADSIQEIFTSDASKEDKIDTVESFLSTFSKFKPQYSQFRLIDASGNEKVNIISGYSKETLSSTNYNTIDFYNKARTLPTGYMYVSGFEETTNSGLTTTQEKPTLLFCTPIYNKDTLLGVVVVNVRVDAVYQKLINIANEFETNLDLLNINGDLITSTVYDTSRINENQNFATEFPTEWSLFLRAPIQEVLQSITDNGLFTYSKLDLQTLISTDVDQSSKVLFETPTVYLTSYTLHDSEFEEIFSDSHFDDLIYTVQKYYFYISLILLVSGLSAIILYYRGVTVKKIKFNSDFDALTATYNRRAGMQNVRNILNSGNISHLPLSICFLDINGLKEVNDNLGHQYGDELIVTAANTIKKKIRANDILMRVGGDEFILVLMHCTQGQAEEIWFKIENYFNQINETEDRPYNISLSHGIAEYIYSDDSMLDKIVTETDQIMYENKKKIKENFKSIK